MDSDQHPSGRRPDEGTGEQKGKEPANFSSRIASSASRLAKDVIGPSGASELPNSLSSGAGLGGKLQSGPSSSTQSHWIESLPSRSRGPGLTTGHVNPTNESFRSSPTQKFENAEFEEFLHPSCPSFLPELTRGSQSPESWTNEFRHRSIDQSGITYASDRFPVHYDDGAEVRMLLSDPSFDLQPDYMDFEMGDDIEANADDLFGSKLSPGEQQAADRIRSSLPAPSTHQPIPRTNPLNLIPGVMGLSLNPHTEATPERIAELLSDLGGSGWEDVLDRYTDDVWGESLQRFVAESIEQGQLPQNIGNADRIQLDGQALTRLKMILGHVAEEASSRSIDQQNPFLQQNMEKIGQARVNSIRAHTQIHTPNELGLAGFNQYMPAAPILQQHQAMASNASSMAHEQTQHSHYQHTQSITEQAAERSIKGQQSRRDAPMANESADEEFSTPAFHCPWIRCHQRFNDARELRFHTSSHTQYACPHEDCTAQFQCHEEWADHITGPHHDLLEHRSMTPISSDQS